MFWIREDLNVPGPPDSNQWMGSCLGRGHVLVRWEQFVSWFCGGVCGRRPSEVISHLPPGQSLFIVWPSVPAAKNVPSIPRLVTVTKVFEGRGFLLVLLEFRIYSDLFIFYNYFIFLSSDPPEAGIRRYGEGGGVDDSAFRKHPEP